FPGNPARGLGVVNGVICVSDAETGVMSALVNVEAVTALRTGAVAAVAAQELAREDARTVGIIGCGVHGSWAARCLAAVEYGQGGGRGRRGGALRPVLRRMGPGEPRWRADGRGGGRARDPGRRDGAGRRPDRRGGRPPR